jgi:ComF family protein
MRCGDVLGPLDAELSTCRPCRMAPPPFVRAVSYGPYAGRMRDAIHALKYDGLLPAARRLGWMLGLAIEILASEAPAEMLVIPVPLHRSKSAQRGFNQARLLATHALRRLKESRPGWRLLLASSTIVRQRPTESQAGLTPHQRRKNVRGAFVVPDAEAVTGRNVLVVDDIMTTGATVRSVAQVLLRAGAANVWVATLARARQGRDHRGDDGRVYLERDVRKEAGTGLPDREPAVVGPEKNQPSF